MIESAIGWLTDMPAWRRWAILLLLAGMLCGSGWWLTGVAAHRQAGLLTEQRRQLRDDIARQLRHLSQRPSLRVLALQRRQLRWRAARLMTRNVSLPLLLSGSQVQLQHWHHSPTGQRLQTLLGWEQLSPLLAGLLHQAPTATISGLRIEPHDGKLLMDLVVEVANVPALAALDAGG